jgi:hypothetical protein
MKDRLWILLLCIGFILSCSSPQKLYEKGNYFKAFDSVYDDLKSGKKKRKDVVLLNKAFSKMIDLTKENMVFLDDGYDVSDLQYNFEQYEELDSRYVKGRSFIDDNNNVKYYEFNQEKINLIDNTFTEGEALMEYYEISQNKIDAQNAYFHFELVQKYGSGFNNIDRIIQTAKEKGTYVYHVDAELNTDFSYQWDVDRKFDNLEREDNFVRIVYDNPDIEADCDVRLDFSRLDIDERKNESFQNYNKQIIDGYTTKIDTSGKSVKTPIYVEVNGSVNILTFRKTVSWSVDFEIIRSNKNCNLRQDRFNASVVDRVEVYDIRGDRRAIPSEFLSNPREEIENTDDMVNELLDILFEKIRNNFY